MSGRSQGRGGGGGGAGRGGGGAGAGRGGGGRGGGGAGRGGGGDGRSTASQSSGGRGGGGGRSDSWRGSGGGTSRGSGGGGGGTSRGSGGGGGRSDFSRGSGGSGFGRGGAGAGRGGPSDLKKVLTNILPAQLSPSFNFYRYAVDSVDKKGDQIESRGRRAELFGIGFWDGILKNMAEADKKDLRRHVYFGGSFFFSSKPIIGLEKAKLPVELVRGDKTEGDVMMVVNVDRFTAPKELQPPVPISVGMSELVIDPIRCSECSKTFSNSEAALQHCKDSGHSPSFIGLPGEMEASPAPQELFLMYANMALDKAMMERLLKWGKQYYDRNSPMPAKDRQGNDLGVTIFEAISLTFGLFRNPKLSLCLTCDLRAKVIRNVTVLDAIYESRRNPNAPYTEQEQREIKKKWVGEVVIYTNDRKCYTITDLDFKNSASSLPIPGKKISHEQYFASKGIKLKYPNEKPMIVVEGRRKQNIFLPPELVAGNELDPKVREMLPQVASFKPDVRNKALEKVKTFLIPASQTSTGGSLLPAVGIILKADRIQADAQVLPAPELIAAGIMVPKEKAENFAPIVGKANFKIDPTQSTQLKVVVFYHKDLREQAAKDVYSKIRNLVNGFRTHYNFGPNPHLLIPTGDNEQHWGAVEKHVSGKTPPNYFILDFCKPRSSLDPAYPVVKHVLSAGGYLSQFVNFKTYSHFQPRDERKSMMILQGVARQILQKAGVRLWWVDIPRPLPLPSVFVGVDVFHAPVVLDPKTKKKGRKSSVAAIYVEVITQSRGPPTRLQSYTRTFSREGGTEYFLGNELKQTMQEAISVLKVSPASVVVWRDGMPETAYMHAEEEITAIQEGLRSKVGTAERLVPMAYIVCQKTIDTKFLTVDGSNGAPSGTLVASLQGPDQLHTTFYINGRAPPYSTPKPVRFICMKRDAELKDVPLARLTWGQCHAYPNWLGPIKVPSVTMKAHKLAELAGAFIDAGGTIDHATFANKDFFL